MEFLDICDSQGRPTGEQAERSLVHSQGLRHRTAHVWILRQRDGRWQVLMQKRSSDKDSFPGMLDTSSAGHIPAGQEPAASAVRELWEELGVKAGEDELERIGSIDIRYEKLFHGRLFKDNEYCTLFLLRRDLDPESLRLQPEEVEDALWIDLEGLWQELEQHRDKVCAPTDSLRLLTSYLRG